MVRRAAEKLRKVMGKQWPIWLLAGVGLLLLLLPAAGKEAAREPLIQPEAGQVKTTENRLEEVLSLVEGAGRVRVMLTEDTGQRQTYQTDTEETIREGETQTKRQTVLASGGSGTETPVVSGLEGAVYRGALVVSQGADDPSVRLALTRAVSAVTGLSMDKITVMKMEA